MKVRDVRDVRNDSEYKLLIKEREISSLKTFVIVLILFLIMFVVISATNGDKSDKIIKSLNETCNSSQLDYSGAIKSLDVGSITVISKNGTIFKMTNFSMEYNITRIDDILLDINKLDSK
jgi:hypothetical protein